MSYFSEVQADNPDGYWRLDDVDAICLDVSGNARHGSYPTPPTQNQTGAIPSNAAALFNGVDDFGSIADNDLWSVFFNAAGSIEAWANPSTTSGNQTIVSKAATSHFEWAFTRDSSGNAACFVWDRTGPTLRATVSFGAVPQGSWTHLVATWDGTTVRTYNNGALVASSTLSGSVQNGTSAVKIGVRDATLFFNGLVDEVAIYPTALSATRVSAHYLAATSYQPPDMSLSYAPGHSPWSPPGSYVDLTNRFVSFSLRRGRQDETARFEPATCSIIVDGSDGLLDPLESSGLFTLADAPPWTPVNITATFDGTDYQIFNGYMLDGPRPLSAGRSRERLYEIECTDLLGWATTVDLPQSRWGCLVTDTAPYLWATGESSLTPAAASDNPTIWNQGSGPEMFRLSGGSTAGLFLDASLVPSDSGAAFHLASGVPDLVKVETNAAIPDASLFACVVWFKSSDVTSTARFLVSQPFRWYMRLNVNGTVSAAFTDATGADVAIASTVVGDGLHDDNATHVAIGYFVRGTNTVSLFTDLAPTGYSNAGTAPATGSTTFSISELLTSGLIGPTIDDVVYWSSPPDMSSQPWSADDLVADTSLVWYGDSVDDRLAHLAGAASMYTIVPNTSCPAGITFTAIDPPANLAEGWQTTAEYMGGAAWIDRLGILRVRDYLALTDTPAFYETQALLSDNVLDDDDTTVRVTSRSRTGFRRDRIVNRVDIQANDVPGGAVPLRSRTFDQDSKDVYGLRTRDFTSEIIRDDFEYHAPIIGQRIIDRFKDPSLEIGDIEIRPWGQDAATEYVITALELESAVQYTESTPDGASVLLDAHVRVQGESWDWQNNSDWKVTLTVSAEEYTADIGAVYGAFTIGDATLGQIAHNRIG